MGVKILLADDSPTVHKVIKIILANEPYEVVECSREDELLSKIEQHKPAIVFLDFNFSENLTGYDLCSSIKEKSPETKVLMMYGTFDAIDEGMLRESGSDQHVVKPFDTNRFIYQVRALADSSSPEPADEWNVQETVEKVGPEMMPHSSETPVESLNNTLSDWGMMFPGVIGKDGGSPEIPPVIEEQLSGEEANVESNEFNAVKLEENSDTTLPAEEDLEYPDLESSVSTEDVPKPKSRLIALNELAVDDPQSDSQNSLELMAYTGMDDGIKNIEDQIRDEVEADLWTVDSFEDANPKLASVPASEEQDHEEDDYSFTASPEATPSRSSAPVGPISLDFESLKPMIQDLVKQAVREYCEKQVEKVAWDVIPDLAENLIKKELQEMARKAAEE